MTKDVIIVDSGMRHYGGHNHSYTNAVRHAFEERGFRVDVFTHKYLDPEMARTFGYRPNFTSGTYDFAPGNGKLADLFYIYAQSVVFAHELRQALRSRGSLPTLLMSHTLSDFELIGWNRFLKRNRFDGNLVLLMRNTPGFASCGPLKRTLHPYWRIRPHYLNAIRRRLGSRFLLTTDSELLTEEYRRVYGGRIVTLPIPIGRQLYETAHGPDGIPHRYDLAAVPGSLRAGYVGDARDLKGFTLLPEMSRRLLDACVPVRLFVQCPPAASGRDDGALPPGVSELMKVAQSAGGRLTLISERLSDADYCELLRQLDIVLIPYRRQTYSLATSAIFAEALALGKPVVVPAGTWMAHELARSGAGLQFESGNAADLAAKVSRLAESYDQYAERARAFSATWRNFHNASKLVELVIDNSGIGERQPVLPAGAERLVSK